MRRSTAPCGAPVVGCEKRWAALHGAASVANVTQNSYLEPEVAQAYDAKNSGRDDVEFYRWLAGKLSAGNPDFAVLDIGCGTGALGVQMAADGHRVTGVDPADAMLDVARNRPGGDACTWIHGYAGDVPDAVADLVVMTGHVAQYFLTEEAWGEVLAEAYRALRPGGWLAFESRNPGRRAWERWDPEHTTRRLPHPDGGELTTWIELLAVDEEAQRGCWRPTAVSPSTRMVTAPATTPPRH